MNVYDHIDANRRTTLLILALFPRILLALTVCVCVLLFETDAAPELFSLGLQWLPGWLRAWPLSRSAAAVVGLTLRACLWLTAAIFLWICVSYGFGDRILLGSAQARPISAGDNPQLFALVENVAIMAGLPMPKLYLIDDESLNAFATGRTPKTASIALTTGIVAKLKPNELESVVAHEMGHVGNRDTRLMILVVTGIAFFMFIAEIAFRLAIRRSFRSSRSDSKGRGGGNLSLVLFIVAAACWVFGLFIAPLIRMALSRNREFLADATAARITHNPDSLADALQKISADPRVEALDSRPLMGALCVVNPLASRGPMSRLYATHPPVEERISRLRKMARAL
jgi:heat shock protein HtpX